MQRRSFLALCAALACWRPAGGGDPLLEFRQLSSELCGVPLERLPAERAARILTELGPVKIPADRDSTEFFDLTERLVNAWYTGWDGLAWECPRGVEPPTRCERGAAWWLTPR